MVLEKVKTYKIHSIKREKRGVVYTGSFWGSDDDVYDDENDHIVVFWLNLKPTMWIRSISVIDFLSLPSFFSLSI